MSHEKYKVCSKCVYLNLEWIQLRREFQCCAPRGIWNQYRKNGPTPIVYT